MKKNKFWVAPAATLIMGMGAFVSNAQDPVTVAPKHYKVIAENDAVRVLRIKYAAGEGSVMHYHPESVVVFISDIKGEFRLPDGSTMKSDARAGDVNLVPAGQHQPMIGNKAIEVIQVELKSKAAANTAAIKAIYKAFENKNMPAIQAGIDSAVTWNEAENFPYADRNPYVGQEAVFTGVFGRIANDWDNFSLTEKKFYPVQDDMVLVTGFYTAKHKLTGKSIKAQFAHVCWIRNGKLVRFQQYADTKQVTDAIIK